MRPAALALVFTACAPAMDYGPPTWHRDVASIFKSHCAQCHNSNGIGPFELDTLQMARAKEGPVLSAVREGRMPPWPASNSCAEYKPNGSLTPIELGTLEAWYEAGAPEGDPKTAAVT